MSYYRYELRTLCRRRLGDLTVPFQFSDEQLNQWINDAIADYSLHFPRVQSTSIACVADDRMYDLPSNCLAILSLEYPTGEDPPEYLYQREYTHPDFWQEDGYYAFIQTSQDNDYPELWISEKPSSGETITVIYHATHDFLDDDDSDLNTVPESHLELVILFVRWAAFQSLSSVENASPDNRTSTSSTLELNASRAEGVYRKMLQEIKEAGSTSAAANWRMDRYDRIY